MAGIWKAVVDVGGAAKVSELVYEDPFVVILKEVTIALDEEMRSMKSSMRDSRRNSMGDFMDKSLDVTMGKIEDNIQNIREAIEGRPKEKTIDPSSDDRKGGGLIGKVKSAAETVTTKLKGIKAQTEASWYIPKYQLLLSLYNTWFQLMYFRKQFMEVRDEEVSGGQSAFESLPPSGTARAGVGAPGAPWTLRTRSQSAVTGSPAEDLSRFRRGKRLKPSIFIF
jgi:hypothetical protein